MKLNINPGNINVRLGHVLQLEEEAWARGDMETASNMQAIEADYLSIYMDQDEVDEFDAMPGMRHIPEEDVSAVAKDLSLRRRFLLSIARRHGVFARAPELMEGDASILDEPEEGEVAA